jgi:DNA-directed RNA polymerase specialized sigma24 family protein
MGYSYKDEMIADAIENCVSAAHSFDPEKSNNPFAYFTQIAWNAFIRRISKEKKQAYIKHKNFEQTNLLDDLLEENYIAGTKTHTEYSDIIIKNFEEKLVKTQKKNKLGIEKFIEEDTNEELTPSTSDCN